LVIATQAERVNTGSDYVVNAIATSMLTSLLRALLFVYGIGYAFMFVFGLGTAIVFQGFGQGHQVFYSSAEKLFTAFVLVCHLACAWYALRLPRHRFNRWLSYLLIAFPILQSLVIGFSSLFFFFLEGFPLIAWYLVLRLSATGKLTPLIPFTVVAFVALGYLYGATGTGSVPKHASDTSIDKYLVGSTWRMAQIWEGIPAIAPKLPDSERRPLRLNADGSAAGRNDHGAFSGYAIQQGKLVLSDSSGPTYSYVILNVDENSLWLAQMEKGSWEHRQFPDLIRYKRARKFIDESTFIATPVFNYINGHWSKLESSWFDASLVSENYEMGDCNLSQFGPEGEYFHVRTQACYRKKGENIIHLEIPSFLPFHLSVGTWKIIDGSVRVESRVVEHNYRCTDCDQKDLATWKTENYEAGQPDSASPLAGRSALPLDAVPQLDDLRKRAIEKYRQLPQ
jgi:hypothetical protein